MSVPPLFRGLLCVCALAHAAHAQDIDLAVERIVGGLELPIFAGSPPGDERIFIIEQHTGRILLWKDGALLEQPFLDVGTEVNEWFEGGLLSMAFHPDFPTTPRVFVSLVDLENALVVREYRLAEGQPDQADPQVVQEILRVPQSVPIHNGGHMEFGPDGLFYVALGDGGPGGDPFGNGQNLGTLPGSILRLDVDLPAPHVPADNPFVDTTEADPAIWIYGLRNPWKFAFDPVSGDLWIGDVGQASNEEVNYLASSGAAGSNLGWRCLEGFECFDEACCTSLLATPALFSYPHEAGRCAVIGGLVYRGERMPSLKGAYLCGDYCSRELLVVRQNEGLLTESTFLLAPQVDGFPAVQKLRSFGVDGQGEILMIDGGQGPATGEIYRLVPDTGVMRYCTASANSAGTVAEIGALGEPALSNPDFALTVEGAVPAASGLFFYGPAPQDVPFGDGRLCVQAADADMVRIPDIVLLSEEGSVTLNLDLTSSPFDHAPGLIQAGETWYFQFWYRDPQSTGARENMSDALAVTIGP